MKRTLLLIVLTTLLLIGAVVVENYCGLPTWQLLLVYLVPYLLIGHDTLKKAFEGIVGGDIEETIANIGRMGRDGMRSTDVEILNIMVGN